MRTSLNSAIYLFGATSIVGWNLYRIARQEVIPFCNHNAKSQTCNNWRRLNFENADELRSIFRTNPPNTLIHCAGICDIEKCETYPEWAFTMNVESVSNLLAILPPETRLVYCSSDHIFGNDGIYTEHSKPDPISVYARSKLAAEKIIREKRTDSLIIRFGLPIGPSIDNRSGHLDWLKYRSDKGLPISIIKGESRSAVWADELATRILALARSSITGVRHIPASQIVSRIVLARYLIKKLHISPEYHIVDRDDINYPHLGSIELQSEFSDVYSKPLSAVVDKESPTLREIT